ncbi:SMI1/KNR4 family protein [Actinoplanes sp. G11-F43]|uniref:SMI1/KNR4 family protein n=1 Tax=Actinoplanes sp. G11-F43 TaxID=3424130 RepID=UPI003D32A528
MIAWHNEGPPVTASMLRQVERDLGVTFPALLRAFYRHHNGGWPTTDEAHPLGVHGYFPIGAGETSLAGTYAALVGAAPRLTGLIPFAYDAGGNTFLAPGRDDGARPVLWLHQENEAVVLEHALDALLPPGPTVLIERGGD